MKDGTVIIYDENTDYVNNLMTYIGDRQGIPFRIAVFTEKEALLDYVSENDTDLLLISAPLMTEDIRQQHVGRIILLSEGDIFSKDIAYAAIYKYQSAEKIIREILEYYAEIHESDDMISVGQGKAQIIGVYSPVRRTGQTTFALTFGQILAADYATLYLNMEEFSALDKLLGQNHPGDLSDLMYFFRQNPEALPIKLQALTGNVHGLDYIPPLLYSQDLRNLDTAEWVRLVQKISETGTYEKIVLDLGSMIQNVFQILDICNAVYMPIHDDRISLMKVAAFEEYMLGSDKEDIANRMVKIKLPQGSKQKWDENYLEEQIWGSLGDFIRKLLSEAA